MPSGWILSEIDRLDAQNKENEYLDFLKSEVERRDENFDLSAKDKEIARITLTEVQEQKIMIENGVYHTPVY